PARRERLAGSPLATQALEDACATGGARELLVDGRPQVVEPHGEQVQPSRRHGAASQGVDHLVAACLRQRRGAHGAPSRNWVRSNCSLSLASCALGSTASTPYPSTFSTRARLARNPETRISGMPAACAMTPKLAVPPRACNAASVPLTCSSF